MTEKNKKTQMERYLEEVERQKNLNDRTIAINTEIDVERKRCESLLKETKEKYGVNSFEELRVFRNEKKEENENILKKMKETSDEHEKEVVAAEEKIKEAKELLNE